MLCVRESSLSLVTLNINGVQRQLPGVLAAARVSQLDVVLLQETRIAAARLPPSIDGWSAEYQTTSDGDCAHGGVGVVCHSGFLLAPLRHASSGVVSKVCGQWLFVNLSIGKARLCVASCYFPPKCDWSRDMTSLLDRAVDVSQSRAGEPVLLGGDFNVDLSRVDNPRSQDARACRVWLEAVRRLSVVASISVIVARDVHNAALATRVKGQACIDFYILVTAKSANGVDVRTAGNARLVNVGLDLAGFSDHVGVRGALMGRAIDDFWRMAKLSDDALRRRGHAADAADDDLVRVRWNRLEDDDDEFARKFAQRIATHFESMSIAERASMTLTTLRDRVESLGAATLGVSIVDGNALLESRRRRNSNNDAASTKRDAQPPWFDAQCRALASQSRRLGREIARLHDRMLDNEALLARRRAVSAQLSATLRAKKAAFFRERAAAWRVGSPADMRAAFATLRSLLSGGRQTRRRAEASLASIGARAMLEAWRGVMGASSRYASQADDLRDIARCVASFGGDAARLQCEALLATARDDCAQLWSAVDTLVSTCRVPAELVDAHVCLPRTDEFGCNNALVGGA